MTEHLAKRDYWSAWTAGFISGLCMAALISISSFVASSWLF